MNDYTYKEHNIYDDGFDELLHRGKEMVSSFLKRPPARQKRKKDQVRHLKAEFKDNILYFDDKKFDELTKMRYRRLIREKEINQLLALV